MYYPTHIADDESDIESSCSAEIEGSYLPQHLDNVTPSRSSLSDKRQHPWEKGEEYGLAVHEDFDDPNSSAAASASASARQRNGSPKSRSVPDRSTDQMAELIQSERNRRLGVSANKETSPNKSEEDFAAPAAAAAAQPTERAPSGLLGNIKGWLGRGSLNQSDRSNLNNSDRSLSRSVRSLTNENPQHLGTSRRELVQHTIHEDKTYTDDDDSSSSSSSSSSYSSISHHSSLDQRTRARHQALRYLSNSCVDAGRKSKTLSYIWGLERLDLNRRRDRFERELGVVEGEMNKDFSSGNGDDKVARIAGRLVRELPRLSLSSGADAGAGSDKKKASSHKAYMLLEEYVDVVQSLDPNLSIDFEENEKNHPSKLLWTNQDALERYLTHLQSRLRETIERTKSLEKRLAVLEKTGDEIVGSLCEDLVDITSHSNKAEARYVKRGKELERKRRRLETNYRTKIKELEKRVNLLEEGILTRSGSNVTTYLNEDTTDSDEDEEENEEDDEIRLEKKLSYIKAKTEQEKVEHELSVQSIRRQCEQSKLKLSVARLVMAGDDNLREYISALERFDPSTQHRMQRRFSQQVEDEIPPEALPPPPPAKVTRGRAKLLKAMHLERIYEQRLAVSKAFNDAAINALEHELADRESAGQQMEVRCLNELMAIDSEIKEIVAKGQKRLESLQKEVRELKDAMSAVTSNSALLENEEEAVRDHLNNFAFNPSAEYAISTDNDSTSMDSKLDTTESDRIEADETSSGSLADQDSKRKVNEGALVNGADGLREKNSVEPESASVDSKRTTQSEDDAHVGDINLNTPIETNDDKSMPSHSQISGEQAVTPPETSHDEQMPDNKSKQLSGEQREKVLKILGLELKCTLAEYQTSIGISSSSDRVEQISYMNQVVLKIAEVSGIDMTRSDTENRIQSWSHAVTDSKKTTKDNTHKKRTKKRTSKVKRRKSKRRSSIDDDGLDEKDKEFLASLSSAKFNT
ncbi:hypothetical protein ACHAXN_009815 [Cyclotella atomus]